MSFNSEKMIFVMFLKIVKRRLSLFVIDLPYILFLPLILVDFICLLFLGQVLLSLLYAQ